MGKPSMTVNKAEAESNLRGFLEKHGREGFLRLLLTNYLFELAMYYLHTEKNTAANIREDTGYRFYVDGQNRTYGAEEIEKFKRDLRQECRKKAVVVVQKLADMNLVARLTEDYMTDPKVAQLVQEAFESITQRT
jgi:hypothetical protein